MECKQFSLPREKFRKTTMMPFCKTQSHSNQWNWSSCKNVLFASAVGRNVRDTLSMNTVFVSQTHAFCLSFYESHSNYKLYLVFSNFWSVFVMCLVLSVDSALWRNREVAEAKIDGQWLHCFKSLSPGKSLILLNDRMVPVINKYSLEDTSGLYGLILRDGLSNQTWGKQFCNHP